MKADVISRATGSVGSQHTPSPVEPFSAPDLSERLAEIAAEEAIAQSGLGTRGHFPGPLFLAVAPIEIEWPQREALAAGDVTGSVASIEERATAPCRAPSITQVTGGFGARAACGDAVGRGVMDGSGR